MAGYVAVKLLKRYRKKSKNSRIQIKRRLFVGVLKGMRADEQPGQPDSPLEYTKLWSQMIDRGGLYNINDDVFQLILNIERIVRVYMNTTTIQNYTAGTDLRKRICEDVFSSQTTISIWDDIAQTIPIKYEKYTLELLLSVVDLWISIRGHSFAKDLTMKFERKYKKGTRKGLKPKKED